MTMYIIRSYLAAFVTFIEMCVEIYPEIAGVEEQLTFYQFTTKYYISIIAKEIEGFLACIILFIIGHGIHYTNHSII